MSEQPPTEHPIPSQTAAEESAASAADSPPRSNRHRDRAGSVSKGALLAVVFAAVGVVGWQWYDTRNQVAALEQELARRLTEGDTRNKLALDTVQELRGRVRELEGQLSTVEGGLAESQSQQVALEALYQQLSRGSDEWALAEIEQTLNIASQQLQLAGN
jgi:uroporphyrin-3 C-methyltransferase